MDNMNTNTTATLNERRSSGRVPLDTPCFANLKIIGDTSYKIKVMISNLSAQGLQADLPANLGADDIPGNSKIELSDLPSEMNHLNNITGVVVWITDGCCGVQFDQELDDEDFLEFLELL